jgi:hypothetical protein
VGARTSRRWRACRLAAACALLASACAPRVFVPPAGPGEPFPDAATAWSEATRACSGASTYAASIHVHGRVGREGLNATILGLVTRADQIYLSLPVMFGPPAFILGGTADRATLWLARDKRVLVAPADDIVEALTGLRLDPRALLALLSGCVTGVGEVTDSARYGKLGAVTTAQGRMFLEQRDGRWRVTRGLASGLIVEYSDLQGDWPRAVRVTTEAGRSPEVSLSMTLEQIDVNVPHDAKDFVVTPGADATPITLEDLRANGPLRDRK